MRILQLTRKLQQDTAALETKLQEAEDRRVAEKDRAKKELLLAEAQNETLQIQLASMTSALADTRIHLLQTSDVLVQATNNGDRSAAELATLRKQLAATEECLAACKTELHANEARVQELQGDLHASKALVSQLEESKVELQAETARLDSTMQSHLAAFDQQKQQLLRQVYELEVELQSYRRGRHQSKPSHERNGSAVLRIKGKPASIQPTNPQPRLPVGPMGKNAPVASSAAGPTLPPLPSDMELPAPSDVATGPTTPTGTGTPPIGVPEAPLPAMSTAFAMAVAGLATDHAGANAEAPPRLVAGSEATGGAAMVAAEKGTGPSLPAPRQTLAQPQPWPRRSWSPPRMPAVEMVAPPFAGTPPAHWGTAGNGDLLRSGPTPTVEKREQ
ncbi:hypothetical protein DFJ74DRAFT_640746 [Hyaloraphidium curvatum]|nr:hypothetical protein DFJ74DRAFT_640746 [Hyaloraphidium curvatum]